MKTRACIYAINSYKNNSLYDYQKYFIKKMIKHVDYFFIATDLDLDYREIFSKVVINKLIIIKISGFDVDKWNYVLQKHRDIMLKVSEIVLCNDSIIGPIFSLYKLFDQMENEKFWGITDHREFQKGNKRINAFLQRYFFAFSSELLNNDKFISFWDGLEHMTSYEMTEDYFEFVFSRFLEDLGYQYRTYIDSSSLMPTNNLYSLSHFIYESDILIKRFGMPFISLETFKVKKEFVLVYGFGNNAEKTYKYISYSSKYPIKILDEVLLHQNNLYDLWNSLNLHKAIYHKKSSFGLLNEISKAVVIFYLYYNELFLENVIIVNKLIKMRVNVIIITDTNDKVETLNKIVVHKIDIRVYKGKGRDWGALLIGCKDIISKYPNICFMHDKKTDYLAYKSVGRDFCNLLWENTAGSTGYFLGILDFLKKNENVGMLVPPQANHGVYFLNFSNYWTVCYEKTIEMLETMNIDISKMDYNKPPISIGSVFWIRSKLLNMIIKYISEDMFPDDYEIDGTINHVLERILPYICQAEGYYTVSVCESDYLSTMHCNDRYMLREISEKLHEEYDYSTFQQLKEKMVYEGISDRS